MSPKIPITLEGSNLGVRHRYLNSLVADSFESNDPIEDILKLKESSHVDRLFKIDLASRHKHVQYILQNLQEDDMLFVSRALKSRWLLDDEHRQIINPPYLEANLYPHMLTTAVNKMKHWIHLNLRDPLRCQEFYRYYLEKDSDYAFKFLSKCSVDIILSDFPKKMTLEKITPQRLKVLCEKTSAVAKLYYEISTKEKSLMKKINQKEQKYFDSIKCILKIDSDVFLDITEQHFTSRLRKLSANATNFIMTHRKDRFMRKPELYTSTILNVSAVAQNLSPEECEVLVIKLARAQYLNNWFSYKNVEPFVKKLQVDKRASFKKRVFVDKNIGEMVVKCPYDVPKFLHHFKDNNSSDSECSSDPHDVSSDNEDETNFPKGVFLYEYESNSTYDHIGAPEATEMMCRFLCQAQSASCGRFGLLKKKTFLDELFEKYRFMSFDKTLFELRKKIKSESSSQNRMYMFLVLVSKSGGKVENLQSLFDLLILHKNEPSQVRAAVIRSLVKRVSVWRVTDDIWQNLITFGRGLGLDGSIPEADCIEGLHAVVIRTFLSNNDCETAITAAFLKKFSTLSNYSLSATEREQIKKALLKMLIQSAYAEKDTKAVVQILEYAIDTLQEYKIKFETQPELVAAIKNLLKNNTTAETESLIKRLFRLKLGRRELFKDNFDLVQTDASYVNALKHDVTILSVKKFLKSVASDNMKTEQFMKKLSVYFMGNKDIASDFLFAMKEAKVHKNFARPVTYLIGQDLKSYMLELDCKSDDHKRFSALIRANAHVARPSLDINTLEWKKAGAKLIANKVVTCKAVDIDAFIKKLLTWKRTARLAIILAQRTIYETDVYATAAKIRPTATLKSALAYFRRQKDQSDPQIWNVVKPLISNTKTIKTSPHLLQNIRNVKSIPSNIQAEYLVEVYKVIVEIDYKKSLGILCRIKNVFSKVDETFIENVLTDFLQNRFILEKIPTTCYDFEYHTVVDLYLNIMVKYLLFSKTEEDQNERYKKVGQLYLNRLQAYWESTKNKTIFYRYIHAVTSSLRNTEVFTNTEYVSCLPVMEKIAKRMRGIIPIEENFTIFVPLHLNMLYYKAIRQAAKQKPGVLENMQRRQEAYEIVGETFGKFIAQEARMLTTTYFDSIIVLYSLGFSKFCGSYNNKNWHKVEPIIIKAIVNASTGIECTLGLQLYDDIEHKYSTKKSVKVDIKNCFKQKNLTEMNFCYRAWERPNYYAYLMQNYY